jgi:flagellar biosynthesis/type III secretory pathway M-ring protein FliF/YscJ
MQLLVISLYELGQFLRIVGWVFVPIFVIVLLITTYIHHRRKRRAPEMALAVAAADGNNGEEVEEDNLYKGMLWMKDKFEAYREQADERVGALKIQLDQRTSLIEVLKEELEQAKEKIAGLTGKLENNMNLLMNAHKELDRSLGTEQPQAITPEAAIGGPGELAKE